jgi:hypothetical protein
MPDRAPFPFVVGCGRSGTTLVRAMLDAHPDMAVPDESYFPVWFGRRRSRYERADGFAVSVFVDDVVHHESFPRWGLDPDAVRSAIVGAAPQTFADAVRAYYAAYAHAHGKSRYADKTPIFVLHLTLLAELFPEAVFVHMIRDGRDVVLSRVATSWGTDRFDFETLQWRSHIEAGRAQGAALGPARYREVRFEDLLDDPERVARELCELAAIQFDAAMLRYHERAEPLVEAQPHPEDHRNLLRPPTKGLRNWRAELSASQVALFDALAGRTLARFGYEPANAPVSARVRARALRARATYASSVQYRRARRALWHAVHPKAPA